MRDDSPRTWGPRVLAPLAFFTAATILVLIVHRSLTAESEGSTRPAAATGTGTQTQTTATGATTTGARQPRRFYRIREGDTYGAIAEQFGTTVEELERLNPNVDPNALTPGQRIRVR